MNSLEMNSLDMEVPADVGTLRRRNRPHPHTRSPNTPLEVFLCVWWWWWWSSDPSNHLNLPAAIRAFIGLALQLFILPV